MEHSQDEESRHLGGYVGRLTRIGNDRGRRSGRLRAAAPSLIGPVKTEHGWNLFKVAKIHKPTYEEVDGPAFGSQSWNSSSTKLIAEATINYPVFEEQAALSTA